MATLGLYPRKERDENKIDGAVALIMAMARALQMQEPTQIQQGFVVME